MTKTFEGVCCLPEVKVSMAKINLFTAFSFSETFGGQGYKNNNNNKKTDIKRSMFQ